MRDDQALRTALMAYAERANVDVESDLETVLGGGRARRRQERTRLTLAACFALVALVIGTLAWMSGVRAPERDGDVFAPTGRLGTWTRVVPPAETSQSSAVGEWTMTLAPDGIMSLSAPAAWVTGLGAPKGIAYTLDGDVLRTNAFSGELCSGTVGSYKAEVTSTTLTLRASEEPCARREAVLAGRWDRMP